MKRTTTRSGLRPSFSRRYSLARPRKPTPRPSPLPATPTSMTTACKHAIAALPPDGKSLTFPYPDWDRTFRDPFLFALLAFQHLSRLLYRDVLRLWTGHRARRGDVYLRWRTPEDLAADAGGGSGTQHGYTSLEDVYGQEMVSITLNLELMGLGNWEGDVTAALVHQMAHAYFLVCCGFRVRGPHKCLDSRRYPEGNGITSAAPWDVGGGGGGGGGAGRRSSNRRRSKRVKLGGRSNAAAACGDEEAAECCCGHDLSHDIVFCTLLVKIDNVLETPSFNYPNLIQCAPLRATRPSAATQKQAQRAEKLSSVVSEVSPSSSSSSLTYGKSSTENKPRKDDARTGGVREKSRPVTATTTNRHSSRCQKRSYCDWNVQPMDFPMRDVHAHYLSLVKRPEIIKQGQNIVIAERRRLHEFAHRLRRYLRVVAGRWFLPAN